MSSPSPTPRGPGRSVPFVKGHGTGNDFVLLPDPDGALELAAQDVVALADRRTGLGADGVVRVVRSAATPEGAAALALDPAAEWFMDHRNADGSLAEMCGNGLRVLVEHLADARVLDPVALASPEGVAVGTRSGVKRVRRAAGWPGQGDAAWWAVDMGPWRLAAPGAAASAGADATVAVSGLDVDRPALSVDLGNPHAVVVLADEDELALADLLVPPVVEPAPPEGTNVELVVALDRERWTPPSAPGGAPVGEQELGRLRMRVHERGVGETLSCGTGVCAAAVAARAWAGGLGVSGGSTTAGPAPDAWVVHVPGGALAVRVGPGDAVELAGPARLVARGVVDLDALR